MGRPLYSKSCNAVEFNVPHIHRSDTPPSAGGGHHHRHISASDSEGHPVFEKWNTWNFDPDSDEFFNSDDAVYEAFTDTPEYQIRTRNQLDSTAAGGVNADHATRGGGNREEGEQDMELVLGDGDGDDDSTTGSDSSDTGSPMAVGGDDPAHLLADWERRILLAGRQQVVSSSLATTIGDDSSNASSTTSAGSGLDGVPGAHTLRLGGGTGGQRALRYSPRPASRVPFPTMQDGSNTATPTRRRSGSESTSSSSLAAEENDENQLPITTNIMPISLPISIPSDSPRRPVTPPPSTTNMMMSPPPSVTPRVYGWGSARSATSTTTTTHVPFLPVVMSPTTGGTQRYRALSNSSARVSVPHLTPYNLRARNAIA